MTNKEPLCFLWERSVSLCFHMKHISSPQKPTPNNYNKGRDAGLEEGQWAAWSLLVKGPPSTLWSLSLSRNAGNTGVENGGKTQLF